MYHLELPQEFYELIGIALLPIGDLGELWGVSNGADYKSDSHGDKSGSPLRLLEGQRRADFIIHNPLWAPPTQKSPSIHIDEGSWVGADNGHATHARPPPRQLFRELLIGD